VEQAINCVHVQVIYGIAYDIIYTNSKITDSPSNVP